jgi:DMSO/TMAO reductase YedYZ molybdopterin-dependent catalytic subunit
MEDAMLKKLGRVTKIKQDQEGLDVPPGQFVTEKFPVLTYGANPKIDLDTWQFRVFGLVDEELTLDWQQFMALPKVELDAEFHCVTQWSRLQNTWEGAAFTEIMELIRPKPEAKYVMAHCYGGYTTNLTLYVLQDEDVLFAYKHDGEPLPEDHGGPLRLVVPKRYGWKSAKWVNGLEFMAEDRPGFWEVRGYHMEGDPRKEQRFWDELG